MSRSSAICRRWQTRLRPTHSAACECRLGEATAYNPRMEPQIRYAKTSDGVNIVYLRAGEGPVLVDVPGAPWSDVQRLVRSPGLWAATLGLAPRMTYVSYDNRGSGGSDRDVTQFSIETDLLDLDAVFARLDVPAVTLFAGGGAGPTAIAYAARYPDRVERLVLLGAWARWELAPEITTLLSMMESNYQLFIDTLAHVIMGFGTGEAAREQAELMRGCTSRETVAAIVNAHLEDDVRELLPLVSAPTLVIDLEVAAKGGVSAGSRYLAANLPNAQLFRGGEDFGATVAGGANPIHRAIAEFIHGDDLGTVASSSAGTRTVLFTDIVGHTEMMQRLGDAKGRDVLREHERITRETLKAARRRRSEDDGRRLHGVVRQRDVGDGVRDRAAARLRRAHASRCRSRCTCASASTPASRSRKTATSSARR